MRAGNREDYLLQILRLTDGDGVAKTNDIAAMMNVSAASVTEMLQALATDGLIDYKKYHGVTLTDEGLAQAKNIRDKHQITERFLIEILNKDHGSAHEEACKMEHVISDESAISMCEVMGKPNDCGDCSVCGVPKELSLLAVPIVKMGTGMTGRISHIRCEDQEKIRKLISMGLVPGRTISFSGRTTQNGPILFRVGESHIALDQELAALVFVDINR